MHAIDLRVDDDPIPLGLDHPIPAFSWIPVANGRNACQQAFRILVAANPDDLEKECGTLWDSGRIASAATRDIQYAGRPLVPASAAWWKVRLWDGHSAEGPWSEPACFGTGPMSEWTATWIGRGPKVEPQLDFDTIHKPEDAEATHGPIPVETESALLRREFTLTRPVRRAIAFVSGLGFYYLHVNGKRIGENVHTPSKTDYRQQVQYDALDLTAHLTPGANAIGLILGNGWYNPNRRWWDWHMQWHGSKRALVQLHITYDDGSTMRLVTDASWSTALGPVREHCLYDGELYDARLEQPGWDCPGFAAEGWTPANEVDAPGGVLRHHAIEPIRMTETIRPGTSWEVMPGTWVFDMGQNFSGVVRVTATGPRGAEIVLRHAENIHPDGSLDLATNNRAKNLDRFILKGQGTEVFQPAFVYHGFRYVEMRGFPGTPTLDSVLGIVLHTASPQTGEFHCANELINHIHRCTVWSQRSNMMGLPTDDNQRDERLGWMADGHLAAEQFMHNFEPVRFYRKWLLDMKFGQNPENGSVPYIVPRPYFAPFSHTAAWSSAYPLVAWYLYEHTGDASILEEHLDAICRYVDYLGTLATDAILPKDRYGDHLSITDGWNRGEPLLASTWYYYYDALIASRMAGVLGHGDIAQHYADLAETVREALNATYFSAERHCYGSGTHCDQIMPLWLEMEPLGERGNVLSRLVRSVMEENHAHLRVGILGAKYALDLFMTENRHDIIWALATRTDYPSLGYMTEGYTTLSETWNRTGTNNHVMWGHIDTWFYQGLAGIRNAPGKAGYGEMWIQPYIPQGLAWARAAVQTRRGRVASGWVRAGDTVTLSVTVPANTSAQIRLPSRNLRDNTIFESGTLVWNDGFISGVEGVRSGGYGGDFITLDIGSGQYRFSFEWRDLPLDGNAEMQSPWRSDAGKHWRLSRLLEPRDVCQAGCVTLADPLDWKPISGLPFINVHDTTDMADGLVYLAKRVCVAESGTWILHVGHDGGVRLFVDGKAVLAEGKRVNPAPRMRTAATLELSGGEHELVIAFDTDCGGGWGLFATWEIPQHARRAMRQPFFPETVV